MNKKVNTVNDNMKSAYIENIILWMVMFVGFATLFFFVLDYAKIIRVKDKMDALSDYTASRISKEGTSINIITELNGIRGNKINSISAGDLVCNSVTNVPVDFKVIIITETTNTSLAFYTNKLTNRKVVYNEVNSDTVTCTLSVTVAN